MTDSITITSFRRHYSPYLSLSALVGFCIQKPWTHGNSYSTHTLKNFTGRNWTIIFFTTEKRQVCLKTRRGIFCHFSRVLPHKNRHVKMNIVTLKLAVLRNWQYNYANPVPTNQTKSLLSHSSLQLLEAVYWSIWKIFRVWQRMPLSPSPQTNFRLEPQPEPALKVPWSSEVHS